MTILTLKDVRSGYGKQTILHNIDLTVKKGEIVSLIGPNGAGKSTVLKTIFGITNWRKGNIKFGEKEIINMSTPKIAKAGIAFVHQGKNVFPSMTVEENIELGAYLVEDKERIAKDLDHVYKLFPILEEKKHEIASNLSGGQQQMVAVGRALMLEPKILMLDEPSIGLAPNLVDEIFDKIKKINQEGTTILMVEQNVQHALQVSNTVNILCLGKLFFKGTPKEVRDGNKLEEAYLGK